RAAGFPARKTLEEFNFDHQPGIRRDDITPLAAGHYLTEARNVVLLGPPGTGKTHVAIALGVAACHTGQRVLFPPAPAPCPPWPHQPRKTPRSRPPPRPPPAIPDSGSCSPPPPTGSPASKT